MNRTSKKTLLLTLGLAFFSASYLWLNTEPSAQSKAAPYVSASVPAPKPGERKVVLKNLGMACPFCKAAVTAKLKQIPGVIAYEVDLRSDSATVLYNPEKVTIEKLKQAIAETGFQVRAVEEVER